MKVSIYRFNDQTICFPSEISSLLNLDEYFLEEFEAEETEKPITNLWKGKGVEVGEVFHCAYLDKTYIRTT